jgi:hypothetical protein
MARPPARLSPFQTQILVGTGTWNESFFSSNGDTRQGRRWGHFMARRLRYEVFWAHFEQNVYRSLHLWAEALKDDYQLYSNVRSVYSPAYRIGEFWSEHLFGGVLDPLAGDGIEVPSAIPIVTRNEDLRPVLAQIWARSNWQTNKDTWTRNGSVLGDTGLAVVDDQDRQQIRLQVIHPKIVREYDPDAQGNCKGYVFEERRPDPRVQDPLVWPMEVTYSEVCTRVGERVRFQTFLDNMPYDWADYEPGDPKAGTVFDWTEDYGFVPFVFNQHRNMGLGWGWSEFQPSLSKLMELDEIVSKLDDQVRKIVECPWLFSGVASAEDLEVRYPDATAEDPEPQRTRMPVLYASDPQAKATALVAPLDIAAVSAHALSILTEIEKDHPELQNDSVSGSASGRARRVAREKTEARVVSLRTSYDSALVRAQMMAISIGAQKRYPGFEKFDAGSFKRGELDHSIGDRPVFAVDTMDHLEEVSARATALQTMTGAGVPLGIAMELAGYPAETINRVAPDAGRAG